MPYKISKLADAKAIPTPFGEVKELTTRRDSEAINMAHISFFADNKHHHQKATEMYYVLNGEGELELDGNIEYVSPGTSVLIQPGTKHRLLKAYSSKVDFLVVSAPAYNPSDEFPDK